VGWPAAWAIALGAFGFAVGEYLRLGRRSADHVESVDACDLRPVDVTDL
jgi:hypothetical protein